MSEKDETSELIPDKVLRRLPKYLAVSQVLEEMGWDFVTSADLARACEVKEMLVRKDLAWTGVVGRPRFGYPIHGLIGAVLDVVGWNHVRKIAFVGSVDIAVALAHAFPFARHGLEIDCIVDDAAAGSEAMGLRVMSLSDFVARQATEPLYMALLSASAEMAQGIADKLTANGIEAIWNFSPTTLAVSSGVSVVDADLAAGLSILCHELVRKGR